MSNICKTAGLNFSVCLRQSLVSLSWSWFFCLLRALKPSAVVASFSKSSSELGKETTAKSWWPIKKKKMPKPQTISGLEWLQITFHDTLFWSWYIFIFLKDVLFSMCICVHLQLLLLLLLSHPSVGCKPGFLCNVHAINWNQCYGTG